MEPVAPERLLAQLVARLDRITWPAEEQMAWVASCHIGIHEVIEEFFDVWPLFRQRLDEAQLLDERDHACLGAVESGLLEMRAADGIIHVDEELLRCPAFAKVRLQAAEAIGILQRPPSAKGRDQVS